MKTRVYRGMVRGVAWSCAGRASGPWLRRQHLSGQSLWRARAKDVYDATNVNEIIDAMRPAPMFCQLKGFYRIVTRYRQARPRTWPRWAAALLGSSQ
jgi:hypothetical protein